MLDMKKSAISNERNLEDLDLEFRAALAKVTKGSTPLDLILATVDWFSHMAISPGTVLKLANSFMRKAGDVSIYSMMTALGKGEVDGPASNIERRMSGQAWDQWPFNVFAHSHKLAKDWWDEASESVDGVSDEHQVIINAVAHQLLDMMSPANTPLTNPEIINETKQQRGMNLVRGFGHLVKDTKRTVLNKGPAKNEDFEVGKNLAITPGKVIFQNDLIELIQYKPVTEKVGAEPVLICPAWIMKYYILDLSPKNSLVKYLTEQGKTVFMVSWKNPDVSDRDVGFEDYVHNGLMKAIDAVSAVCPKQKINAVGYCIGGTLLAATAATMAREGDERLNSVSLFAAQVDFSEAGEIKRFVSPSQLSFLESVMWKKGYMEGESMGAAFGALRASDLIFGSQVDRYLLGKTAPKIDLMVWNSDATRMPYRMHSEYLKQLYLENRLGTNRFEVDGKPISISDIRVPVFVVGTETDHVAPWKSVYKFNNLARTEVTFLLTSGGHNAGIISGREHPRRHYRVNTQTVDDRYIDPDTWMETVQVNAGSWWSEWDKWLDRHISKQKAPPRMGASRKGYKPLYDAPGKYVLG